jgi:glucose/arabinose dehydrogenase
MVLMEQDQEAPEIEEPDAQKNLYSRYKKYILLAAPILLLIIAGLAASYLLSKDTPKTTAPPASPPKALNPPKVELVLFTQGLPSPTAIVARNDSQRLYVVDQSGIIRIVNPDGTVADTPFLDIKSRVLFGGEMGLLGLAFSPSYAKDGFFFINYIDKNRNTVIARYHAGGDKADPDSEQKLLILKQPYDNHNGGDLAFGRDGFLYATLGDGGSGGDPQNYAQNLNSLLGKTLRLDVSQIPYKIPETNPFVNQSGKRGEIWNYGLRNHWRISFDRQTHELYIADVGQGNYEEINIEPAGTGGKNYGWRCYEGLHDFSLNGCGPKEQYSFPHLEYDHSEGRCSITGGYVYRGSRYPALDGKYFYGDLCSGQVYLATKKGSSLEPALVTKTSYQISTFGQDSRGEIYMADYAGGNIYRIVDSAN